MIKATLIKTSGIIETIEINHNEDLTNYIEITGHGPIEKLYSWLEEGFCIELYGYTEGRITNKHDLPEPLENKIYYGDMVVLIKNNNNQYEDCTKEDYNEFYEYMFEGFDDCVSEDYFSAGEYDFSDDFIVNDLDN